MIIYTKWVNIMKKCQGLISSKNLIKKERNTFIFYNENDTFDKFGILPLINSQLNN